MNRTVAFLSGIVSGILGAMSSSRGAELRFPVLARFQMLPAMQLNLWVSLLTTIVVCCADRSGFLQTGFLAAKWRIYVNFVPGSLLGAIIGTIWIGKMDEAGRRRLVGRALIFFGIFLVAYSWLIVQRIHFHAGFVRSVITIIGALIGGFLTAILGTGSEAICIATLAIFHDFDRPMGEAIASTAAIPTLLLCMVLSRGLARWNLPKGAMGLVLTMSIGSVLGILLMTHLSSLNPGWLVHSALGLILIFFAISMRHSAADRG
jgi:uncharacterized membrane protein YfcA